MTADEATVWIQAATGLGLTKEETHPDADDLTGESGTLAVPTP